MAKSNYGEFKGEVIAKWLHHDGDDRLMLLMQDFTFIRKNGEVWTAPKGSKVDGATVPRLFWSYASPYVGNFRRASVIHDYYCYERTRPSRTTHRVFYEGCRTDKLRKMQAKVMYLAVRFFGPDWLIAPKTLSITSDVGSKSYDVGAFISLPVPDNPSRYDDLRDWVEQNDPTLDEIDQAVEPLREPAYLKGFREPL